MTTIKSRINISLPDEVQRAIVQLAKRDQMPAATKAEHLLEIGLELEEDQAWNQIASKRDNKKSSFLSHAQTFKV